MSLNSNRECVVHIEMHQRPSASNGPWRTPHCGLRKGRFGNSKIRFQDYWSASHCRLSSGIITVQSLQSSCLYLSFDSGRVFWLWFPCNFYRTTLLFCVDAMSIVLAILPNPLLWNNNPQDKSRHHFFYLLLSVFFVFFVFFCLSLLIGFVILS